MMQKSEVRSKSGDNYSKRAGFFLMTVSPQGICLARKSIDLLS